MKTNACGKCKYRDASGGMGSCMICTLRDTSEDCYADHIIRWEYDPKDYMMENAVRVSEKCPLKLPWYSDEDLKTIPENYDFKNECLDGWL